MCAHARSRPFSPLRLVAAMRALRRCARCADTRAAATRAPRVRWRYGGLDARRSRAALGAGGCSRRRCGALTRAFEHLSPASSPVLARASARPRVFVCERAPVSRPRSRLSSQNRKVSASSVSPGGVVSCACAYSESARAPVPVSLGDVFSSFSLLRAFSLSVRAFVTRAYARVSCRCDARAPRFLAQDGPRSTSSMRARAACACGARR